MCVDYSIMFSTCKHQIKWKQSGNGTETMDSLMPAASIGKAIYVLE